MTANDWVCIERARARREGVRRGALLGSVVAVIVTLGICIVIHTSLMMRSDALHESVVAALKAEAQRDADAYLKGATATAYTAGWAAAEESRMKEGR